MLRNSCDTHRRDRNGEATFRGKFREGVRIEMICGKRVLDYLNMINEQNHQISVKLSAKMDKTAQAVERLQEENFRLKGQVGQLVDDMCRKEAER